MEVEGTKEDLSCGKFYRMGKPVVETDKCFCMLIGIGIYDIWYGIHRDNPVSEVDRNQRAPVVFMGCHQLQWNL